MKTRQLTPDQARIEKRCFMCYALFIIIVMAVIILTDGCTPAKESKITGTPEQWDEFNKCIDAHPSDAVCDSCYKVVFNR